MTLDFFRKNNYALCLLYYSNTERLYIACLLPSLATITGRLLGRKDTSCYRRGIKHGFATFRLLARCSTPPLHGDDALVLQITFVYDAKLQKKRLNSITRARLSQVCEGYKRKHYCRPF